MKRTLFRAVRLEAGTAPAVPRFLAARASERRGGAPRATAGLLAVVALVLPSVAAAQQGGSITLGVRYPTALGAFGLELDTARNAAFGVGLGVNTNQPPTVSAFGKLFMTSTQAGPYLSVRFDTRSFEDNYLFGVAGYRADLFNAFVDLEAGFGRRLTGTGDGANPFTVGAQLGMRF